MHLATRCSVTEAESRQGGVSLAMDKEQTVTSHRQRGPLILGKYKTN